ncbi:hypothetical protein CL176_08495 [Suicoccus acidiformans]|uniref:VWFA domain-containing protein n=1 Tax=Suicoccus acidiformans TaxID=2036206 RepID=A0A347WLS9_9LACT|nr:VWA domain-containing protein [Suicoccus acidiformans]AXY26036.1 hypothetical protein CL176_08495 [Suicoccus acidiformans]
MRALKYCLVLILSVFLVGCADASEGDASSDSNGQYAFQGGSGEADLTIVAGSENEILEPIIQEYAESEGVTIGIDYMGSLDIMRLLQSGEVPYDAVWPASSIWLDLGDEQHLLKYEAVTSISPIVFGVRDSLAEQLGFKDGSVQLDDIMQAIESGQLNFAMTSATQSNSGASAYIGFLTALSDTPDSLTSEDLADPTLHKEITQLLSGVNRSSGSSNWLVDLFLQGNYDAMVNYETLIIQANHQLIEQGKEPLYLVYPEDALSISDSPLAYVDHEEDAKEEAFLAFQSYLLADETQSAIEATGRRSAYGEVREANQQAYPAEWGIDLDRVISPVRWPQASTIQEALTLYQTEFKKPGLTLYVLDYSGSMNGEGHEQMMAALEQVLIPENASQNLLLPTSQDETYIVPFAEDVGEVEVGLGNDSELSALYTYAMDLPVGGGTALYEGVAEALRIIDQDYPDATDDYTPAIVVLSDGVANGDMSFEELKEIYQKVNKDIPIFSIQYGDASDEELEALAQLSRARVFDGRKDLIGAFQKVKGYN